MKCMAAALMLATLASLPASADTAVPQFQVDPLWPKPLPNNWILGQVSGIATDRFDRIWIVHRGIVDRARTRRRAEAAHRQVLRGGAASASR